MRNRSGFDVVRYAPAGTVARAADADDAEVGPVGVLSGHFSVFDRWYEIDSAYEGNFLERVAPGTFEATFAEDVQRCWFEHGDSPLGRFSLGSVETLTEDATGAYYEVRLFDGLPAYFLDGLRAGEYGASFRMRITGETIAEDPGTSEHNPRGLPEVTITKVRCPEFGPVSIGASPFATAALRSGTDDYYEAMRARDPELVARARAAAGLEDLAVELVADGGTSDGASNTADPDRGRAALARLARAGVTL